MALPTAPLGTVAIVEEGPASPSAVSWAAVIGGALIAVASTLLLVALGSGIGLSSVSPWSPANPSATTFTLLAAVWLIIVQWLSSGLGGYLAGRLRTKWVGLHTDEVFFRDTAHGFLAWALATVLRGLLDLFGSRHRNASGFRMLQAARHPEPHRRLPLSAQGVGDRLLLFVLLDADWRLHRLRCWRDRRSSARPLTIPPGLRV